MSSRFYSEWRARKARAGSAGTVAGSISSLDASGDDSIARQVPGVQMNPLRDRPQRSLMFNPNTRRTACRSNVGHHGDAIFVPKLADRQLIVGGLRRSINAKLRPKHAQGGGPIFEIFHDRQSS
jgi:hypothetical protein